MTAVYRTYLDASELLPPLAYFFLFMLGGFAAAFAGLAVLLARIGVPDAPPPAARDVGLHPAKGVQAASLSEHAAEADHVLQAVDRVCPD